MPAAGIGATAIAAAGRGIGAVERVEQVRRGFDEIAARGERIVARNIAEPDQPFAFAALGSIEAQRFARRIVTGELARRDRLVLRRRPERWITGYFALQCTAPAFAGEQIIVR